MTLSTDAFMTGLGTGQENTTRADDTTSTSKALAGASISSFTDKDKYTALIANISDNITSNNASIKVLGQVFGLSGSNLKAGIPELKTGLKFLDEGSGVLGGVASSLTSSITSSITGIASSLSVTSSNTPNIINLSEGGFLDKEKMSKFAADVKSYMPPSTIALDSFNKLGAMIDKEIKDTLFQQLTGLKGTELLCSGLCLLLSLLPCKITNSIVDVVYYIKEMQGVVKSGIDFAVAAEDRALSQINSGFSGGLTGLANINDIRSSVTAALGKNQSTEDRIYNSISAIKSTVGTLSTIVQVLNLLLNMIKLSNKEPWKVQAFLTNGAFCLLDNVLVALQSIAVQIADSLLNKVISPLEGYLNNNTFPALCGFGAQLLFRKLLKMIYDFKDKILQFIADLFTFQKTKKKKFELFNENMSLSLELSAYLKIFKALLDGFLDIAIACSITKRPCPDNDTNGNNTLNMSYNYIGQFDNDPPYTQLISSTPELPKPQALNEISTKMQPIIDSIFPGTDSTVSPGMITTQIKDMPPLIQALIDSLPLTPDFSIYHNDNNATIVYKRASFCS